MGKNLISGKKLLIMKNYSKLLIMFINYGSLIIGEITFDCSVTQEPEVGSKK